MEFNRYCRGSNLILSTEFKVLLKVIFFYDSIKVGDWKSITALND